MYGNRSRVCNYWGYEFELWAGKHPLFPGMRWVRTNRRVIADKLGRRLKRNEIVHHKNEDKLDNREENLTLHTRASHQREHYVGKQWSEERKKQHSLMARERNLRPKYNKMISKRAKKQHKEGKLGAVTWKTDALVKARKVLLAKMARGDWKPPMLGKKHSEATKRKMSRSAKNRYKRKDQQ